MGGYKQIIKSTFLWKDCRYEGSENVPMRHPFMSDVFVAFALFPTLF